jgi:hypothetical protein
LTYGNGIAGRVVPGIVLAALRVLKGIAMRQTIVGVFERHADAVQAAHALQAGGLGPAQVQVTDATTEAPADTAGAADDSVAAHIRSFFAEVFGPTPEHHAGHAELVRRGGALVRVDLDDDQAAEAARRALHASGASRIDLHTAP